MLPQQVLAHQQAPEDVDMLPVAGHGAGLRPGLLSSVEPIGIVGTPSCEVAGVEVLDCEDVALPAPAAGTHVVVIGAGTGGLDPDSVREVMLDEISRCSFNGRAVVVTWASSNAGR